MGVAINKKSKQQQNHRLRPAQKHNKKQERNNINDTHKKHRLQTVSKNILLEVLNRKANNKS